MFTLAKIINNAFVILIGITRKDCLARLLKLQHALHGSAYNFAPHSYILPNDYRKFTQEFSHQADKSKAGLVWYLLNFSKYNKFKFKIECCNAKCLQNLESLIFFSLTCCFVL